MGSRHDCEIYWAKLALNEINHELPEFDSESKDDYLDWEFTVDQCVGDFPHSSRRLGAIIAKKLVNHNGMW